MYPKPTNRTLEWSTSVPRPWINALGLKCLRKRFFCSLTSKMEALKIENGRVRIDSWLNIQMFDKIVIWWNLHSQKQSYFYNFCISNFSLTETATSVFSKKRSVRWKFFGHGEFKAGIEEEIDNLDLMNNIIIIISRFNTIKEQVDVVLPSL